MKKGYYGHTEDLAKDTKDNSDFRPHHKDAIVRAAKTEAMENEEEFDGVTTE